MTDLGKMFEEMADSPSPPRRVGADELYAAGRRRYRRRRNAVTAGVTALVVAAVATLTATGFRTNQAVNPPTLGDQNNVTRPYLTGKVQWAVAADSQHLFVATSSCQPPQCAKGTNQIVGSDDGGRTWSDRGAPIATQTVTALGPETLVAAVTSRGGATREGGSSSSTTTLMISRDAARTWSEVPPGSPLPAVPAGGRIICDVGRENDQPCEFTVVDPTAGRSAALANPPALIVEANRGQAVDTVGRDGLIWIGGHDPDTGRPAVVWSRDAGRSWSTHVFREYTCGARQRCADPIVSTVDGSAVYTVLTGGSRRVVYRGTVSGDWRELDTSMVTYYPDRPLVSSFVTNAGTHMLGELRPGSEKSGGGLADLDTFRFWAAGPGDTVYRQQTPDGLPAAVSNIQRTTDGWYYAIDYPDNALYGSTDGQNWSRVAGTR